MTDHTADPFAHLMPRLRKRARRLSRTPEEAEDLAQETALRLWQGMERAHNIENPEHYAMITLHNLARQRWRTRRPTEELADDMAQQPPAAPARLACAEARAAIARLPAEQEQVMEQLLAGESSPQAISDQMGVPVGTVMSRLARARARLREELEVTGSVSELL
jgi:RNA polymerase sigma-70 factor (ECF subfamily)